MTLMPEFQFHRPVTLDEAVKIKASAKDARFVAGGEAGFQKGVG